MKTSLTVKDQNLRSWETGRWKIGRAAANGQGDLEHLHEQQKSVTAITAGKGDGQVVQKDSKIIMIFFPCWELSLSSRELWQLRSTGCQEWHQNDQVKWAVWLGI